MAEKKQPKKIKRQKRGADSGANTAKKKQHATIKVTLAKSIISTSESHRATVRGLGLRRLYHTVELEDTPAVRGMISKVGYLLKCEA
jgi:large subunit ribosomal protein L30